MFATCSICGEVIAQTILGQLFGAAADEAAHKLARHYPAVAAAVVVAAPFVVPIAARAVWRRLK